MIDPRKVFVPVAFILLVSSVGIRSQSSVGIRSQLGARVRVVMVVVMVCAGVAWWMFGRRESTTEPHSGADRDVWDAIPSWQYDGRHVESGGLARDEQERAIGEIQRRAESVEEVAQELSDESGR